MTTSSGSIFYHKVARYALAMTKNKFSASVKICNLFFKSLHSIYPERTYINILDGLVIFNAADVEQCGGRKTPFPVHHHSAGYIF